MVPLSRFTMALLAALAHPVAGAEAPAHRHTDPARAALRDRPVGGPGHRRAGGRRAARTSRSTPSGPTAPPSAAGSSSRPGPPSTPPIPITGASRSAPGSGRSSASGGPSRPATWSCVPTGAGPSPPTPGTPRGPTRSGHPTAASAAPPSSGRGCATTSLRWGTARPVTRPGRCRCWASRRCSSRPTATRWRPTPGRRPPARWTCPGWRPAACCAGSTRPCWRARRGSRRPRRAAGRRSATCTGTAAAATSRAAPWPRSAWCSSTRSPAWPARRPALATTRDVPSGYRPPGMGGVAGAAGPRRRRRQRAAGAARHPQPGRRHAPAGQQARGRGGRGPAPRLDRRGPRSTRRRRRGGSGPPPAAPHAALKESPMTKTMTSTLTLAALAALLAAGPAHADGKQKQIALGRKLVTLGGCNDCHTPLKMGENGPQPDLSRLLSGHPEQLAMPPAPKLPEGPWMATVGATMTAWSGPWGVSYTANLTPDPETGLGRWTEQQFIDTAPHRAPPGARPPAAPAHGHPGRLRRAHATPSWGRSSPTCAPSRPSTTGCPSRRRRWPCASRGWNRCAAPSRLRAPPAPARTRAGARSGRGAPGPAGSRGTSPRAGGAAG